MYPLGRKRRSLYPEVDLSVGLEAFVGLRDLPQLSIDVPEMPVTGDPRDIYCWNVQN